MWFQSNNTDTESSDISSVRSAGDSQLDKHILVEFLSPFQSQSVPFVNIFFLLFIHSLRLLSSLFLSAFFCQSVAFVFLCGFPPLVLFCIPWKLPLSLLWFKAHQTVMDVDRFAKLLRGTALSRSFWTSCQELEVKPKCCRWWMWSSLDFFLTLLQAHRLAECC